MALTETITDKSFLNNNNRENEAISCHICQTAEAGMHEDLV